MREPTEREWLEGNHPWIEQERRYEREAVSEAVEEPVAREGVRGWGQDGIYRAALTEVLDGYGGRDRESVETLRAWLRSQQ